MSDKPHKKRILKQLRKKTGKVNFVQLIESSPRWSDLYHGLLSMEWWKFFGLIFVFYLMTNVFFALAYWVGGNGIANAQPGSFADAFFFSVQTLTTIGYGAFYPTTLYTHIIVTFESLFGLLGFAVATGLLFARFSKPTARVLFSEIAVIAPYNGVPTLMFRMGNQRNHWIVEAQVRVSVILPDEMTPEGHRLRPIVDLNLVRSHNSFLVLSWMIMHPIDEQSPFYHYGLTPEKIQEWQPEVIVSLTGLDETVSQTIHSRYWYHPEDIRCNVAFVNVVSTNKKGTRCIDYTHFHDVEPLQGEWGDGK
ncbi:ion channel [Roseofilum sp. BLCC_M91]|uniref:Ion channel n=1 Tax=Roseofilum halophilum BLCC-M91 TaxID=3022259 RepID=A0ABT7BL96_9CYAN|nr:ion channel [Roseofilum halophilum]MDJ1179956.1 ion channel [Roseofilum halophilum BLCC-M91]